MAELSLMIPRMEIVAMQFVSGLLFGSGMLTAVVIFRVLLHVSVCG